MRRNILVTGAHRSGTTWVGRMLALAPGVRYIHEPFNVNHPNREAGFKLKLGYTYAPGSAQLSEIERSLSSLLSQNPFEKARRACRRAGVDAMTPLRFGKHFVRNFFYSERILLKDPVALMSAGWLHERFDLDVICLIRNPLAFSGSVKHAGWTFDFRTFLLQEKLMKDRLEMFREEMETFRKQPGDAIDNAALLWKILHWEILQYRERYPVWHFVKHEELATASRAGFSEIFRKFDISYSGATLAEIEKFSGAGNPAETETADFKPRDAAATITTWRRRLTDEEADRVLEKTREVACHFYSELG